MTGEVVCNVNDATLVTRATSSLKATTITIILSFTTQ